MKTNKWIGLIILLGGLGLYPTALWAGKDCCQPKAKPVEGTEQVKPYPLKVCLVTGKALADGGAKAYTFKHEGREIKFCCKDCLKTFKQNPAKYIEKLDAEIKPTNS
jgi:YHS domain-containing protein